MYSAHPPPPPPPPTHTHTHRSWILLGHGPTHSLVLCDGPELTRKTKVQGGWARLVRENSARRSFRRCRQVETSSERRLRRYCLSAVMMHSFSARHKRHDLDLLEYARAVLLIDHVMVRSALALSGSQMRFESSVAFARCSCLHLVCMKLRVTAN